MRRNLRMSLRRDQRLKLLGCIMLLLWMAGGALYWLAFSRFSAEHLFSNVELALRSAVGSLRLFMFEIDGNVMDQIPEHPRLKAAIAVVCVLASACTLSLLLTLLSARFWAYCRLLLAARRTGRKRHVYLFFGMSVEAELTARSVRDEDGESIRIFVETETGVDDDGTESWQHLLAMMVHRRESFRRVRKLDARLAVASSSIGSLGAADDVLAGAGLRSVRRMVSQLGRHGDELHVFFLSQDARDNLASAQVISRDRTLCAAACRGVRVVVYCRARRDSVSTVAEYSSLDSGVEVRIVDPVRLAVLQLKMKENAKLLPVNFVRMEKDGTTASSFHALVVGFDDMGQEALRFLYEYGAFVSADRSAGVRRADFCCHVVDAEMRDIAPHYLDTHLRTGRRAASGRRPLVAWDAPMPADVNLHSYGYRDKRFFSLLDEIGAELNYVVIALADDAEGAMLAVWLVKHAMRCRKDLGNFKILLRSSSPGRASHADAVAGYYNGLLGGSEVIHVFGRAEDIYTFHCVAGTRERRESWLYYNSYHGVTELADADFGQLSEEERATGNYCSVSEPDYAWNIRRQREMKRRGEGTAMYSAVMSVRRTEAQDRENAFHRHTKRLVALKALGGDEKLLRGMERGIRLGKITRDGSNHYHADGGGTTTAAPDGSPQDWRRLDDVMTTLAQTEHLRWTASHEMLGYVWGPKRDDAHAEHVCMTEWGQLASETIRGYDYDVVDRSFRLADEEREKESSETKY